MYVRNTTRLLKTPFWPDSSKNRRKSTKIAKIAYADFQAVTKKVHFFCIFFAKKFGQFKNLLYLCIRFRSKMGHAPKEHKQMIFERLSIHNKIVVQELNKSSD